MQYASENLLLGCIRVILHAVCIRKPTTRLHTSNLACSMHQKKEQALSETRPGTGVVWDPPRNRRCLRPAQEQALSETRPGTGVVWDPPRNRRSLRPAQEQALSETRPGTGVVWDPRPAKQFSLWIWIKFAKLFIWFNFYIILIVHSSLLFQSFLSYE